MATTVAPITLSNFTGLDFNQILQATMAAAQIPITQLQNEVTSENLAISTLGTIGGDFTSLQSSLSAIDLAQSIAPTTATVSAGAPFGASVTGAPLQGMYSVGVAQLASAQTLASQGFASDSSTVGTGTITVTSGGTQYVITIDSSNDTLDGVAGAITSAGAGVTAQVVNTGLPGAPYRLQVTSNATGLAQAFSITNSLSGGASLDFSDTEVGPTSLDSMSGTATPTVGGTYTGNLSQGYHFTVTSGGTVGSDPITIAYSSDSGENGTFTVPAGYSTGTPVAVVDGLTLSLGSGTLEAGDSFSAATFVPQVSAAQDAKLQVGSQIVTSPTNQVTNAIPGVTLTLSGTGGPSTVTISPDEDATSNLVSGFVSAYNTLLTDINSNTQVVPNQNPPPLPNDGGLRMVLFSLQNQLGTVDLSKLGISIDQQSGQLVFDQSAFSAAESSDSSGVTQALGQLYSAINPVVQGALDPNTGVIAAETASNQSQVNDNLQRISNMNNQLQQQQAQLQAEYGQIQAMVANYQSLSQLFDTSSGSSEQSGSSTSTPGSNLTISA